MKGMYRDMAIGYPHMETSLSLVEASLAQGRCEGAVQGQGHRLPTYGDKS